MTELKDKTADEVRALLEEHERAAKTYISGITPDKQLELIAYALHCTDALEAKEAEIARLKGIVEDWQDNPALMRRKLENMC